MKRQIWFENNDLIRDIESGKEGVEIHFNDRKIIVSKKYFNANPCLYPYWITKENYSMKLQEHTIMSELLKKYGNIYSAFYGGVYDKPLCKHIGDYTQGIKIVEGQPGYDSSKCYDPDKKYYSNSYLKEYD